MQYSIVTSDSDLLALEYKRRYLVSYNIRLYGSKDFM